MFNKEILKRANRVSKNLYLRYGFDKEDAYTEEDVSQQLLEWYLLWDYEGTFKSDLHRFNHFLSTVVPHRMFNWIHSKGFSLVSGYGIDHTDYLSLDKSFDETEEDSPKTLHEILGEDLFGDPREDVEWVQSLVMEVLNPAQYLVFTLYYLIGMTQQEIADDMETTQQNIARILSRCYLLISEELLKYDREAT